MTGERPRSYRDLGQQLGFVERDARVATGQLQVEVQRRQRGFGSRVGIHRAARQDFEHAAESRPSALKHAIQHNLAIAQHLLHQRQLLHRAITDAHRGAGIHKARVLHAQAACLAAFDGRGHTHCALPCGDTARIGVDRAMLQQLLHHRRIDDASSAWIHSSGHRKASHIRQLLRCVERPPGALLAQTPQRRCIGALVDDVRADAVTRGCTRSALPLFAFAGAQHPAREAGHAAVLERAVAHQLSIDGHKARGRKVGAACIRNGLVGAFNDARCARHKAEQIGDHMW